MKNTNTNTNDSTNNEGETPFCVYSLVTDKIIALLEAGTVPWRKTWKTVNGQSSIPANWVSKKAYRGVNVFLLGFQPFQSPYWLTFNQARNAGGSIRKGSKSTPIVFWKRLEVADKENPGKKRNVFLLRYFNVFNMEQTNGIDYAPKPATVEETVNPFQPIAYAAQVADSMPQKPALGHGGNRAFYAPMTDSVTMPKPETFDSPEAYYSTLFHELTHSTGHQSRLEREGVCKAVAAFGSETYSKEELVAEMGTAFLCGHCGLAESTIDNSASYIAGWLRKLKEDKKLVVSAAGQAQKAADFILGTSFKPEED